MANIEIHLPSPEESLGAEQALRGLDGSSDAALLIQVVGSRQAGVALPPKARALLLQILGHLANGDAVTVVPMHAEVTAQEAAELLGVSRPFVVRMIEEGKIACRLVGTHRRIPLADLLAFKEANKAERRKIAADLTAEAQELVSVTNEANCRL